MPGLTCLRQCLAHSCQLFSGCLGALHPSSSSFLMVMSLVQYISTRPWEWAGARPPCLCEVMTGSRPSAGATSMCGYQPLRRRLSSVEGAITAYPVDTPHPSLDRHHCFTIMTVRNSAMVAGTGTSVMRLSSDRSLPLGYSRAGALRKKRQCIAMPSSQVNEIAPAPVPPFL